MTKRTTRSIMREILRSYPKGIGLARLAHLVAEQYATCSDAVKVMACHMRSEGEIVKDGQIKCETCCKRVNLYRLKR